MVTQIHITTIIDALLSQCFDLSRDVKIHERSTIKTNERAFAGRTEGLFEMNDSVTLKAKHFGIEQYLTVRITKMDKPYFFEDIMEKGAFKIMIHKHYFTEINGKTQMTDYFEYEDPFGIFGLIFDKLVLKKYMTRFLESRNQILKVIATNVKH